MTTKPTAPEAEQKNAPQAAGPAAATVDASLATVVLSHHLRIGGREYPPGSKVRVTEDYARRLRSQGYIART
jgi:hypothetical protein